MKGKIVRVLLGVLGGSLTIFGIAGISRTIYEKGKNDAYNDIAKDMKNIIRGMKLKEESIREIEEIKGSK